MFSFMTLMTLQKKRHVFLDWIGLNWNWIGLDGNGVACMVGGGWLGGLNDGMNVFASHLFIFALFAWDGGVFACWLIRLLYLRGTYL